MSKDPQARFEGESKKDAIVVKPRRPTHKKPGRKIQVDPDPNPKKILAGSGAFSGLISGIEPKTR